MAENQERNWTFRKVWRTNGKCTIITIPQKIAKALNCKEGHPLKMTLDGEKCILENLEDVIRRDSDILEIKTDEELYFVEATPKIQSENNDTSKSE